MRNFLFFLLLILPCILIAQEEKEAPKYQSLFWKIEGKGMSAPSYLYGTMHVSHKIAYHLNDEFYEAIQKVDQIALETNPDDWMDQMIENNKGGYRQNEPLYDFFVPSFIEKENFKYILKQNNDIVNGILYRNSDAQQNYQEETYLDMFIYQAGGKLGKPVLALEDLEEADELVQKASLNSYDPKREYSSWLKKKLQEKGIVQLIEEAYRDKNLDLIDSLNFSYYPEKYNQYMLYQRNRNIVNAMDTVMKKGTVFVGIGAAHLPGENGVIEYLRNEGYTVSAIEGDLTKKGIQIKEKLENNFKNRTHLPYTTNDNFISLELPDQLYEFNYNGNSVGLSMDITNGAYFLIFRTSKYSNISKEKFGLEEIDEMLYENIPGKIEQQNNITFQGYPALEIINKTKSGEYQKYLIVETPLEIITFKLGGKKEYAKTYDSKFFKPLKLNRQNKALQKVQPFYGSFSVEMPGSPILSGNNESSSLGNMVEIQSMDKNNGYYFAKELVYNDFRYIEEDEFEVEYIHRIWYENIDTSFQKIETFPYSNEISAPHSFSNSSTPDGKDIRLFSIKKGPRYYLLGTVNVDSLSSEKYFSSLEFIPYVHEDESYEIKNDTSLFYSVVSSVEAPPYVDYYGARKDEDTILAKYQNATYKTPYKELINVSYNKYHSYYEIEHVDSIWNRIQRRWTSYDYILSDQKEGINEEGQPYFSMNISRENSQKIIHNYYCLNYGVMYLIQYDSYKDAPPSAFIDTFFNTFQLVDTLIGRSPLHTKSQLFFDNIYSTDSLTRDQALKSYKYIDFKAEHVSSLMKVIQDFDFEEKELNIKIGILEKLGQIEDKRVFPFLKNLYSQSEDNSLIQLEVIYALIKNPNTQNYKSILDLLKTDIPLSSERTIYNTFSPLMDSLAIPHASVMFPDLLEYSSISEYKTWIYQLATKLKNKGYLKTKILKKYKQFLINELTIEYKRQKTKDINKKANNSYNYYSSNNQSSLLDEYISLLAPFHSDPEIKKLFNKIKTLENARVKSILIAQLAKHNGDLDETLVQSLASNPKTRYDFYSSLKKLNQIQKFPEAFKNQQAIAEGYLIKDSGYPKIDSTQFYKKIIIPEKKNDYVIYFFKTLKKEDNISDSKKEINEDDWGIQYIAYKVKDQEIITKDYYDKSSYEEMDFEDKKELKKYFKEIKDKIKYKKRKRIGYSYPSY